MTPTGTTPAPLLHRHGLRIRALPGTTGPDALAGTDPTPDAADPWRDPSGGAPLRCCLRDSRPGEQLVLTSVVPPGPRGPYAERGPVFVHAQVCDGPADEHGYPEDWRARRQVFRAYDRDGKIIGGTVVEPGDGQEAAAAEMFDDPSVAFVQTRNVVHGCYMATIVRAAG